MERNEFCFFLGTKNSIKINGINTFGATAKGKIRLVINRLYIQLEVNF